MILNIVNCIKISYEGRFFIFTDHVKDIVIKTDQYKPNFYIDVPDITESINGSRDAYHINFNKNQLQQIHNILQFEVLIGADISLIKCNALNDKVIFNHQSTISNVKSYGDYVNMTVSNIFKSTYVGAHFSPLCRANFCDSNCTLKMANHSKSVQIVDILRDDLIKVSEPNLQYDILQKFGISPIKIKSIKGDLIEFEDAQQVLKIKDTIQLQRTCNKSIADCIKFKNAVNFRGEPHINNTISFVL